MWRLWRNEARLAIQARCQGLDPEENKAVFAARIHRPWAHNAPRRSDSRKPARCNVTSTCTKTAKMRRNPRFSAHVLARISFKSGELAYKSGIPPPYRCAVV